MYYPYFRGKQYELILLRDNAEFLSDSHIYPIIEPVRENLSSLKRSIAELNEYSVETTLIINPMFGEMRDETTVEFDNFIDKDLAGNDNVSLGYIVNEESELDIVRKDISSRPDFSFSLIHYGYTHGKHMSDAIKDLDNIEKHIFIENYTGKLYQKHFKSDDVIRVLIRDGFKMQDKNKHYPDDEHFSDLHLTFEDERMAGFGDFLMVGDEYREVGGPAYAIAIHMTYIDEEEDDMFIRHFISDRTDSPVDPAGKFLEALDKLVKSLRARDSEIFRSDAAEEYITLFKQKHFPGLGYVKKLSMQHHIELIADFLRD